MTIKQRITREIEANNKMIEFYKSQQPFEGYYKSQAERFEAINQVLLRVSSEDLVTDSYVSVAKDALFKLHMDIEVQKQTQEILMNDATNEFPIAAENSDLRAVVSAMIDYKCSQAVIEALDYVLQTIVGMMKDLK